MMTIAQLLELVKFPYFQYHVNTLEFMLMKNPILTLSNCRKLNNIASSSKDNVQI